MPDSNRRPLPSQSSELATALIRDGTFSQRYLIMKTILNNNSTHTKQQANCSLLIHEHIAL